MFALFILMIRKKKGVEERFLIYLVRILARKTTFSDVRLESPYYRIVVRIIFLFFSLAKQFLLEEP